MSDFRATVSLIGETIKIIETDKGVQKEIQIDIEDSSPNQRNLEVIKVFGDGHCRISSIAEVPILKSGNLKRYAFRIHFTTTENLTIQDIIKRFNSLFVFKSISEVGND